MFSYLGHKYIGGSKSEELYKNYEFIDEEKFLQLIDLKTTDEVINNLEN